MEDLKAVLARHLLKAAERHETALARMTEAEHEDGFKRKKGVSAEDWNNRLNEWATSKVTFNVLERVWEDAFPSEPVPGHEYADRRLAQYLAESE